MPTTNAENAVVKVFVYPGGKPEFVLESNLLKNGELTFNNGQGKKGFDIDFVLANADETGYFFPANEQRALSASLLGSSGGSECPPQGTHWLGFQATGVSADRKTLSVFNTNDKKQRFGYSLWVTQKPEQPNSKCKALDPIGNNQNGYRATISPYYTILGVGALGAAVYACTRLAG